MQAVESPLALELAREVKRAVAPDDFVDDTLKREQGLKELHRYLENQKRKAAQEAALKAEQKAEQRTAEKMLITAIRNGAAQSLIEAMRLDVGVTDSRLAELMEQANMA